MAIRELIVKDEELVLLAQHGDKRSMDELLHRHSSIVRACARKYFLAGGETDDLIQEGMIGLCYAIGDYKQEELGASFKNFAYLCVKRRILDAVKSGTRKKNFPLNGYTSLLEADERTLPYGPDDVLIKREDESELFLKMKSVLSNLEYDVIVMYLDGSTMSEICEAMGKTFKCVDNALQRSKKKLQKFFNVE